MTFIGLDNGVTGSIGLLVEDMVIYKPMPVFRQLNYTKSVQWLHRIDAAALTAFLGDFRDGRAVCVIERPMINPGRWKATVSAIRALEATQTVLEMLRIPYHFIDSKEWQHVMLPSGFWKIKPDKKGKGRLVADPKELKEASFHVGRRLFPQVDWTSFKDADGLLIAEYARRSHKVAYQGTPVEEVQSPA